MTEFSQTSASYYVGSISRLEDRLPGIKPIVVSMINLKLMENRLRNCIINMNNTGY